LRVWQAQVEQEHIHGGSTLARSIAVRVDSTDVMSNIAPPAAPERERTISTSVGLSSTGGFDRMMFFPIFM